MVLESGWMRAQSKPCRVAVRRCTDTGVYTHTHLLQPPLHHPLALPPREPADVAASPQCCRCMETTRRTNVQQWYKARCECIHRYPRQCTAVPAVPPAFNELLEYVGHQLQTVLNRGDAGSGCPSKQGEHELHVRNLHQGRHKADPCRSDIGRRDHKQSLGQAGKTRHIGLIQKMW